MENKLRTTREVAKNDTPTKLSPQRETHDQSQSMHATGTNHEVVKVERPQSQHQPTISVDTLKAQAVLPSEGRVLGGNEVRLVERSHVSINIAVISLIALATVESLDG